MPSMLDAEGRDTVQADVNQYFADFVNAVARGLGVSVDHVRTGIGEGRMLCGTDAMAAGMADDATTFSDVIAGRALSPKIRINASTMARLPSALACSLRELALLN